MAGATIHHRVVASITKLNEARLRKLMKSGCQTNSDHWAPAISARSAVLNTWLRDGDWVGLVGGGIQVRTNAGGTDQALPGDPVCDPVCDPGEQANPTGLKRRPAWLVQKLDLTSVEPVRIPNMVRKPEPQPGPGDPGLFLHNRAKANAGLHKAILSSAWGQVAQMADDKTKTTPRTPGPSWSGSTLTRPGVVTLAVTQHQEAVRAERFSSASTVAIGRTLIRTLPATFCAR